MKMTEELKPCPFCGGKNIDLTFWARNDGTVGPGCDDCNATADSAEVWNKRQAVAIAQGEPTAWLETFYEEEGGKETKVWLVEPKPDESTLSIQPLYVGRPAEGEPASASDLVKIAAELHRAKWQFDLQDETRLTMSEARQLVIRAFEQMHRIGDMALKMRDAAKSQSPAEKASDDYNQGYNAGVEWATKQYSQPERVELPADGSPPAWCCKGAAPAAACRCAIEEGELVRLRAQVERLTAAVSGLFAGGFIEAGVRESDQWSQELDVRIGHLKSALPSTEKK
jgi:hypothetical protein